MKLSKPVEFTSNTRVGVSLTSLDSGAQSILEQEEQQHNHGHCGSGRHGDHLARAHQLGSGVLECAPLDLFALDLPMGGLWIGPRNPSEPRSSRSEKRTSRRGSHGEANREFGI